MRDSSELTIYRIRKAEFLTSAPDIGGCPDPDRPEIAFLGRSNVGKSSMINALLGKRNLAIASRTPGRTRLLNYFNINDEMYFVDLPGYGYAKVSAQERDRWNRELQRFLMQREPLCLGVLIVDMRHEPHKSDLQVRDMLQRSGLPLLIVATKSDKLNKSAYARQLSRLRKAYANKQTPVLPFSSLNAQGIEEFWWELARRGVLTPTGS